MKKKIALVAFSFFFIGVLFGTVMFDKPAPKNENQEVKSAIATIEPTQQPTPTQAFKKDLYSVIKVIDGDTITVNIDGKIETIRLIGIDSPESVDPRKPVQCFGKEASDKAREVLMGKRITIELDPTQGDKDKYKRLLRFVFLEDGTNFNKLMIEEGYAHEYTYNVPYEYQDEFKVAELNAREEKRGLWADGACNSSSEEPQKINEQTPAVNSNNAENFSCAGKTTCDQMSGCEEANFYLNNCSLTRLDGDKDGVPCETLCR